MKRVLNRLMAKLGYYPAPVSASVHSLKIEVDSSQITASLDLLQQFVDVAQQAEAAVQRLNFAAGITPATGANASGLPG